MSPELVVMSKEQFSRLVSKICNLIIFILIVSLLSVVAGASQLQKKSLWVSFLLPASGLMLVFVILIGLDWLVLRELARRRELMKTPPWFSRGRKNTYSLAFFYVFPPPLALFLGLGELSFGLVFTYTFWGFLISYGASLMLLIQFFKLWPRTLFERLETQFLDTISENDLRSFKRVNDVFLWFIALILLFLAFLAKIF